MARDHEIKQEHIDSLCKPLAELLAAELQAGNNILETWQDWPEKNTMIVMLEFPFLALPESLPDNIAINEIDDERYWLAEYEAVKERQFLACQFEGH